MTVTLIVLFVGSTVLWLSYWMLVKPYLLDSVQADIYELESALDWAVVEGYPGSQTESAQMLSKYLKTPVAIRAVSISTAVYFRLVRKAEIKVHVEKYRLVINGSPDWLKDMWQRYGQLSLKATLANSPAVWIPLALILLGTFFSYKIARWWKDTEETAASLACQPG